jgi:nucleoside-diphosphate-sugar epimerase
LVTGGAGFLGSHVVDLLLERGNEVSIVDNLVTGRLQNVNAAAAFAQISCAEILPDMLGPDVTVIHLAAVPQCTASLFRPLADLQANYLEGLRCLTACLAARVRRFVFVSSMAVYGDAAAPPFREGTIPRPRDPYAVNKFALEQIALIESALHGVEVSIVRPQHVFGPRQAPHLAYRNVIARWIRRALSEEPLPVIGTLALRRAFSPVSLVARGIVAAAESPVASGEIFNLGTRRLRTLGEIVHCIEQRLATTCRLVDVPAPPSLLLDAFGAVDKAENLLGISEQPGEFEAAIDQLVAEIQAGPSVTAERTLEPEFLDEQYYQTYVPSWTPTPISVS